MPLHDRVKPFRDARLFVVAIEGEETGAEVAYFRALEVHGIVDVRRVEVRIIATPSATHDSAPDHVLDRCGAAMRAVDDRLVRGWLVFDVDMWKEHTLAHVCQQALQCDLGVAVSNPCFELWVLLHHQDLGEPDLAELAGLQTSRRSQELKRRLRASGGVNDLVLSLEVVMAACARARALPGEVTGRWPGFPGTFVHKLIQDLLEAGALRGTMPN